MKKECFYLNLSIQHNLPYLSKKSDFFNTNFRNEHGKYLLSMEYFGFFHSRQL